MSEEEKKTESTAGSEAASSDVDEKKKAKQEKREKDREKKRADQKKAAKAAKTLTEYTYRDMGQELIMRRKMWRAITLFIMTLIGLIVFIALFIDETKRVQETYRAQYKRNVEILSNDVKNYLDSDGDLELRYRIIVSSISNANNFAFLQDDFLEKQKTINSLYTVILKYPQQCKERMTEIDVALDSLVANEGDAYQKIDEFVESIDLKGY